MNRKGCGSHNCVIQSPLGIGTNGPCICRDWKLRAEITHLQAENERLREAIAEIKEIYTGMDGFIAETAPEAYLQRILRQIFEVSAKAINKEL